MSKKVVVVIYEYFYPGFKAGGPIQSLVNLVSTLHDQYIFRVITTAYDLHETSPYQNVVLNEWNDVMIADNKRVSVWYSAAKNLNHSQMLQVINQAKPDVIFIGGMFTTWSYLPLLLKRMGRLKKTSVVVSPRGMLQKGALATRSLKKEIFLTAFKMLGLHKGVTWHATDEQEHDDIRKMFGNATKVITAANIPKSPVTIARSLKKPGTLSMIYLSLITEKKNLLLVLEALKHVGTPVKFDIYGPVKDEAYWKECLAVIKDQVHSIKYCGLVKPGDVQKLLSQYDVFVLPTRGENFGHAIYEALSVGTPALISPFTPWGNLKQTSAGLTISLNEKNEWVKAIEHYIDLNQDDFNLNSKGAQSLANAYFLKNDFKSIYFTLFNGT